MSDPSALRRTVDIRTISHLYPGMSEYVVFKNAMEMTVHIHVHLCLDELLKRHHLLSLVSWHLYQRYLPFALDIRESQQ